jgi:hypothetical protein
MQDFKELARDAERMAEGAPPETKRILEGMASDFRSRTTAPSPTPRPFNLFILAGTVWLLVMYLVLAWSFERQPAPFFPKGQVTLQLFRPFQVAGHAAIVSPIQTTKLEPLANDPHKADDTSSPVVLYEDGKLLGPAHNNYTDIQNLGAGRFSHWKETGIVFSASDNSDPNTNGRVYWAVVP